MSFDHPSIDSCEKADDEIVQNFGQYSPPFNMSEPGGWDDKPEDMFVPSDYVQADFVETTNVYDLAAPDENLLMNGESIYDGAFKDPSNEEWNREERNRAKEKELQEREKLIFDREQALEITGVMPKNWPWFWPITYHDIEADIPTEFKAHTRRQYWLCLATWVGLF